MANADLDAPINDETIEMLEKHVKKGKPRKFFMIYKGASLKTLVVFKKGPFGPRIMAAKKNGFKGDVTYGVVVGSGKNLVFQLPANGSVAEAMKVDSWEEKPPIKKAKLKEFLRDAGLDYKPDFQMVTEVASALDPETDEAVTVDAKEIADDSAASSGDAGDASTDDSVAASLSGALKKLRPMLDSVLARSPELEQDLKQRMIQIASQIKSDSFDEAREGLLSLGHHLKDLSQRDAEREATGDRSLVALGKLRLEWQQLCNSAVRQIKALQRALQDEFGDDDEQSAELADADATLQGLADALQTDLPDQLDDVLNADTSRRDGAVTRAKATIKDLASLLAADPIIAELDGNEVLPATSIREPMRKQLAAIARAIG